MLFDLNPSSTNLFNAYHMDGKGVGGGGGGGRGYLTLRKRAIPTRSAIRVIIFGDAPLAEIKRKKHTRMFPP